MKISYRREPGFSYMVVEYSSFSENNDFHRRMLAADPIPSLLPLSEETLNGITSFLFDISGKQAFDKTFEVQKLSNTLLLKFLDSIKLLYNDMSEHLLDINTILIRTDSVFLDHSLEHFYFCCIPGLTMDFLTQLKELFNDLLTFIDYDDQNLVMLAFSLNRCVQEDNFTLSDIFEAVSQIHQGASELYDADPFEKDHQIDPIPLHPENDSENEMGFLDKARGYFTGRTFSEVFDDINSGRIIRRIRDFSFYKDTSSHAYVSDPDHSTITFNEKSFFMPEVNPAEETVRLKIPNQPLHYLTGLDRPGDMVICLNHFPFTLGKEESCVDYQLNEPTISRTHCRLYETDDGTLEVEDLNSRNGTFINNVVLNPYERKSISPGDLLSLSSMKFLLR